MPQQHFIGKNKKKKRKMAPSFDDSKELYEFVVKNGNGVKGLVDSGIEKVPNRYIQPSQERIEKIYSTKKERYSVRAVDLSKLDGPNHGEVVEEICRAAETVGFFQVVNHGVPLELLTALKVKAHNFFEQPAEGKAVYLKGVSPSPLVKYGTSFVPEKEKALEWKDYVSMVYTNDAQQQWPEQCKEESLEYLKTSMKMVRRILEILFQNLGVEVESSKMESLIGFKMVNMNFYPKCPNPDLTVGVGRHSDMGTLTILLQDGIGGLHVKLEQEEESKSAGNKKQEWIEIPPVDGALVVNVGDALQILSNGKYKSAEHRVRTTSKQSRVSVPIFTAPLPTEKIAPLPQLAERDAGARYREIIFQDYMNNFFGKGHEGKKSLDFAKINSD